MDFTETDYLENPRKFVRLCLESFLGHFFFLLGSPTASCVISYWGFFIKFYTVGNVIICAPRQNGPYS